MSTLSVLDYHIIKYEPKGNNNEIYGKCMSTLTDLKRFEEIRELKEFEGKIIG